MWGCLTKIGISDFKWVNVSFKAFDTVFIAYAQNSVANKFMSLNVHSICESREAKKI